MIIGWIGQAVCNIWTICPAAELTPIRSRCISEDNCASGLASTSIVFLWCCLFASDCASYYYLTIYLRSNYSSIFWDPCQTKHFWLIIVTIKINSSRYQSLLFLSATIYDIMTHDQYEGVTWSGLGETTRHWACLEHFLVVFLTLAVKELWVRSRKGNTMHFLLSKNSALLILHLCVWKLVVDLKGDWWDAEISAT